MPHSEPISEGRHRVVIEAVQPCVDGGRFAIKRCIGDRVEVEADAFCDGHDRIACMLCWRHEVESPWYKTPMTALGNDRWRGEFNVTELGCYRYTIMAWADRFLSWQGELAGRNETADILLALRIGADLLREASQRILSGEDQLHLLDRASELERESHPMRGKQLGLDPLLAEIVSRHPDPARTTVFDPELQVCVDRPRARYGNWYELFPRSCLEPGSDVTKDHGTFQSTERRLPYLARLGFNVLYLPPIHPIGTTHRKGANNALIAAPTDPGCPWAIGGAAGGHKAIEPRLGALEDFRHLVAAAEKQGMEIALDIAFQCSPDHPYVTQHPEWFRHRPDGSIQYAENPPKKYEDIYPLDFETANWRELWMELKSIFDFWIAQGVTIFRVDNPHTKAFPFWQWVIGTVRRQHPEVIFLSEAFTRPKLMYRLAKLGFSQSYTYFTWRNAKGELTDYFTELTQSPVREFFRPNLWPNTPDILNEYLQRGGRAGFQIRLILAATLGASYGIYGPAFELHEAVPREPGSEEYRDSEKYQLRYWDINRPDSLAGLIAKVNRIRREHPALQQDWNLTFFDCTDEHLLCYGKQEGDDTVIVAVNLDPHNVHSGTLTLPLERFGLKADQGYPMDDLLNDQHQLWQGPSHVISVDPNDASRYPAHIYLMRKPAATERDFDMYKG